MDFSGDLTKKGLLALDSRNVIKSRRSAVHVSLTREIKIGCPVDITGVTNCGVGIAQDDQRG
jgi:hypothetical protein